MIVIPSAVLDALKTKYANGAGSRGQNKSRVDVYLKTAGKRLEIVVRISLVKTISCAIRFLDQRRFVEKTVRVHRRTI